LHTYIPAFWQNNHGRNLPISATIICVTNITELPLAKKTFSGAFRIYMEKNKLWDGKIQAVQVTINLLNS